MQHKWNNLYSVIIDSEIIISLYTLLRLIWIYTERWCDFSMSHWWPNFGSARTHPPIRKKKRKWLWLSLQLPKLSHLKLVVQLVSHKWFIIQKLEIDQMRDAFQDGVAQFNKMLIKMTFSLNIYKTTEHVCVCVCFVLICIELWNRSKSWQLVGLHNVLLDVQTFRLLSVWLNYNQTRFRTTKHCVSSISIVNTSARKLQSIAGSFMLEVG